VTLPDAVARRISHRRNHQAMLMSVTAGSPSHDLTEPDDAQ